jgi:uncharacterized protein YybS (DUF2232 family)
LALPGLAAEKVSLNLAGLLADPAVLVVNFMHPSLRVRRTLVFEAVMAVFVTEPTLLLQGMQGLSPFVLGVIQENCAGEIGCFKPGFEG